MTVNFHFSALTLLRLLHYKINIIALHNQLIRTTYSALVLHTLTLVLHTRTLVLDTLTLVLDTRTLVHNTLPSS
jgi:hypothetical protein